MAVEGTIDAEVRASRSALRQSAARAMQADEVERRAEQLQAQALAGLRSARDRVLRETTQDLRDAGLDPTLARGLGVAIEGIEAQFLADTSQLVRDTVTAVESGAKTPEQAMRDLATDLSTMLDLALAAMDRSTTIITAVEEEGTTALFLYDGPLDSRTRDDCREWAGKVFTLEEMRSLSSEAGPQPPARYGGGWGCRHRWVPVSPETVEAMDLPRWRA